MMMMAQWWTSSSLQNHLDTGHKCARAREWLFINHNYNWPTINGFSPFERYYIGTALEFYAIFLLLLLEYSTCLHTLIDFVLVLVHFL